MNIKPVYTKVCILILPKYMSESGIDTDLIHLAKVQNSNSFKKAHGYHHYLIDMLVTSLGLCLGNELITYNMALQFF